jgi:DNA-binding NarL/FixJ family response regulator
LRETNSYTWRLLSRLLAVDAPVVAVIRVLVADDHRVFAEALMFLLQEAGGLDVVATTATTRDTEAAVAAIGPDVVVLDVALGSASGIELTSRLRAEHPDIPVVIVTAHARPEVAVAAVRAGALGFVGKDSSMEVLTDAIHAAARGEASIPATLLAEVLRRLQQPHVSSPRASLVGLFQLTQREAEVTLCLVEGLDRAAIAERLYISTHTVRTHLRSVLQKLGAHSRLEVVAVVRRAQEQNQGSPF